VERELAEDADDVVRILSGLLRRGDHGEAFRERRTVVSWSASEAGLLSPAFAEERGTAVRIRRGREALLFAREGDGPSALREVVRDASRRAGGSPFLKPRPRPAPPAPAAPADDELATALARALARALPDPRGLSLTLTVSRVVVTRAVITPRAFLLCGTSSRLVATGAVRRSETTRPFAFQSAAPLAAAADTLSTALREAVRPVPAAVAPQGTVDVVLSPAAASVFWHEVVGHPLEAEGGGRHSVLSRVPHAAVAPPGLFVSDDPTRGDLPGGYRYDDEGTPARGVPLIEDGRVVGLLTDCRTGGDDSNGHGRCSDYRRPPRPRLSNLVVPPGSSPLPDLLERCGSGLYVREISAGSLEPESGRFFLVVEAADGIRRGRLGAPVARFALSGDLLGALRHLDPARGETPRPAEGLGLCVKGGDAVPVGGASPALILHGLAVTPGRS
jgi:TldD protein